jgi:hypothetical protein
MDAWDCTQRGECQGVYGWLIENKEFLIDLINKTAQDGNERGVFVCRDEGEGVRFGTVCDGTDCQIELVSQEPCEVIGEFHTHPAITDPKQKDPGFSLSDYSIALGRSYMMCYGAQVHGKPNIVCKSLGWPNLAGLFKNTGHYRGE